MLNLKLVRDPAEGNKIPGPRFAPTNQAGSCPDAETTFFVVSFVLLLPSAASTTPKEAFIYYCYYHLLANRKYYAFEQFPPTHQGGPMSCLCPGAQQP
jgi:hypothetical protein